MAAAIPTIAIMGASFLASKLAAPKMKAPPAPVAPPPAPDAALMARHAVEAAQTAAGVQRARAQGVLQSHPSTLLTGPAGLPTPAPVVRKTLLGS